MENDLFKRVDQHINDKMTSTIKTAIGLIVDGFDNNLQSKVVQFIKQEFDSRFDIKPPQKPHSDKKSIDKPIDYFSSLVKL